MLSNREFFVNWFKKEGRTFPWRREKISPFSVLVTEILLRRTMADKVSEIWMDFTNKYPDPKSILVAKKGEISKDIESLGLSKQKEKAFVEASNWLINRGEEFPSSLKEILFIPHIGVYSANAILCFSFGRYVPIVDCNIIRFFSRYKGIKSNKDNRRNPLIWELAKEILPGEERMIKEHNYGFLDFSADICKPQKPRCFKCPLEKHCYFSNWKRQQEFVM